MLWFVTAVAGVLAEAGADAGLRDVLARALEANGRWEQLAAELRAENAQQREENAGLAVLRRLVFGRSSERARPETGRDEAAATKRSRTATAGLTYVGTWRDRS